MAPAARELAFRPRARLISILGEHLISDQAVALVELVKNAYDADARHVTVEVSGTDDVSGTVVVISDDGTGMTLDDLATRWLSPAADEKARAKATGQRTALGRLPIGEKGVGRFALHQLGRSLEMVTRAEKCPEYVISVDWDLYDGSDGYLDSVPVAVTERQPVVFADSTGTRLTVGRPRTPWDEKLLRKVQRALRRLQSPLREAALDFEVTLRCPDHPEFEEISATDILPLAHYEFRVMVDGDGQCDYEYTCRHPGVNFRELSGSEDLCRLAGQDVRDRGPRCGPFWMNLYVWDRSRDALAASGVSRRELDALAGVSLYRDGLRVLPYGEPGNDWLFLDQERIQAPAERIGNNQVIGLVEVDQSSNLRLRDKTNREGLIENDAFLDLRLLVRAAIRLFTTRWRADRPPPSQSKPTGTAIDHVVGARRTARAVRASARNDVHVDLSSGASAQAAGPATSKDDSGAGVRTVSQPEAVDVLLGQLDDVQAGIQVQREHFERLLQLAATGLAAERVVHEFGRQLAAALAAMREMKAVAHGTLGNAVKTLESVLATLEGEFRILAPYETIRRAPRTRPTSLRELAGLAVRLNQRVLRNNEVRAEIIGDDLIIPVRGTQVLQILDNLVYNAAYWLGTNEPGHDRRLALVISAQDHTVMVADNGPGVSSQAAALVFEPFFSMKEGGSGLGLYISAELARAAGGSLSFVKASGEDKRLPAWATGAAFELRLRNGAGESNG